MAERMESNNELQLALAIGELIVTHGIPAAIRLIQTWKVEEPTLEDIRALKEMKPAAEYFEAQNDG